jgi:hypothetical protein
VDVSGTADVVSGEQRLKNGDTIGVCRLNTPKSRVVKICCIGGVTVALGRDTTINTGGVALPNFDIDFWNRFASVDINDLEV